MAEMSCPNPLFLTKLVIYWQCFKRKSRTYGFISFIMITLNCRYYAFSHIRTQNSNTDKTEFPNALKMTSKKKKKNQRKQRNAYKISFNGNVQNVQSEKPNFLCSMSLC